MKAASLYCRVSPTPSSTSNSPWGRRFTFSSLTLWNASRSHKKTKFVGTALPLSQVKAFSGGVSGSRSWDDEPYEILADGTEGYLDELDIVSFLDPPKELIPLDPASYNPAAYLWKKIEDIPEERRHRLLYLLKPSKIVAVYHGMTIFCPKILMKQCSRLISRAWETAGMRYDNPKLAKKSASDMLSGKDISTRLEYYYCRTSGGAFPISWINFFKEAVFRSGDEMYGRLIGESFLARFASFFYPLYFRVTQLKEVMSTEQPCDLAFEFGDGQFDECKYPEGFPKPVKHPYPFNDELAIYIRHIGPGVLVGQAWREGRDLQQLPQKLCGEILMVKDYAADSGRP